MTEVSSAYLSQSLGEFLADLMALFSNTSMYILATILSSPKSYGLTKIHKMDTPFSQ